MRKEIEFDDIVIFQDDHHPYTFGYYDDWGDCETFYFEVPKTSGPKYKAADTGKPYPLREPGMLRLLVIKLLVEDIRKNTHRTFGPGLGLMREIRNNFSFPKVDR